MDAKQDVKKRVVKALLDAARDITGSDYKTAKQLNVGSSAVSQWRSSAEISADKLLQLQRFVAQADRVKMTQCVLC